MKFYILVKNDKYGEIKSETYEEVPEKFDNIVTNLLNGNTLDFFDSKGNFVIFPEDVYKKSLIYLMKVK